MLTPAAIQQESPGFKKKGQKTMSGLGDPLLLADFLYEHSLLPTWTLQGRVRLWAVHSQARKRSPAVVSRKDPESLPKRLLPGT